MRHRALHPAAWWGWALALAATATRTTNPVLLGLLVAVAWFVVASRRVEAPWARSFGTFLRLALLILAFRLVLQALFAARIPGTVLFTLPAVTLPDWAAGMSIGGPVTAESMVAALYDGLQLGTLLICVGAANSLTSPYRLLRSVPASLYEAGVALNVAMAFAPMASASARTVQDARRLRGRPHRGVAGAKGLAVPVLESALDRSIQLAASMDARGYGRRAWVAPSRRRGVQVALAAGLLATLVGVYGLLDAGAGPGALGWPALALGAALLAASLVLGSSGTARTRYRPDPWLLAEWVTVAAGVVAFAAMVLAGRSEAVAAQIRPTTYPLSFPSVPVVPALGLLVAALPGIVTPSPAPQNPVPTR